MVVGLSIFFGVDKFTPLGTTIREKLRGIPGAVINTAFLMEAAIIWFAGAYLSNADESETAASVAIGLLITLAAIAAAAVRVRNESV
jgi:hypothetical protein